MQHDEPYANSFFKNDINEILNYVHLDCLDITEYYDEFEFNVYTRSHHHHRFRLSFSDLTPSNTKYLAWKIKQFRLKHLRLRLYYGTKRSDVFREICYQIQVPNIELATSLPIEIHPFLVHQIIIRESSCLGLDLLENLIHLVRNGIIKKIAIHGWIDGIDVIENFIADLTDIELVKITSHLVIQLR